MRAISIGFTAPSTSFEGATISIQCTRYFEGDEFRETYWETNVWAAEGGWVAHPDADNAQDDTDSFISMLAPFYDGSSLWTLDESDQTFTFWEMICRTLPKNID